MNKKISRRDLFKFMGGSAAGLMLTPIPWKLLDDSAIWTQNWPWIPEPLKGKFQTKYSTCTLCPAACGVRVRCVGDQPVSVTGAAGHPISNGALCALGFAAAHMPYHPARVLRPFKRNDNGSTPVSIDEVVGAIAEKIKTIKSIGTQASIAVLDGQPGRTMSAAYRRFLSQVPNGKYLVAPSGATRSFDVLGEMLDNSSLRFGFDVENARTVVSFGAPILDGWGTPGRVMSAFHPKSGQTGNGIQLIQIETRYSRTAALADLWLPIRPGTETAMALGLANVMIAEKLYDSRMIQRRALDFEAYRDLVSRFTPEFTEKITGVASEKIVGTARSMAKSSPTLVVGGAEPGAGPLGNEEEFAIWGLNFLLGSIDEKGGVLVRKELKENVSAARTDQVSETQIEQVPDGSIRLLIIDDAESGYALPPSLLAKKLAPEGAVVVSLSPYLSGLAPNADYVVPAPTFLESLRDVATPPEATVASLSLSVPLVPPPGGATEPIDFLQKLATAMGLSIGDNANAKNLEPWIKKRVESIHKSRRGGVFTCEDNKVTETKNISSPDDLWKMLTNGGCWIDQYNGTKFTGKFSFLGRDPNMVKRISDAAERGIPVREESKMEYPLFLMPFGWRGASGSNQISPIMSKVYQESNLRHTSNLAFLNPSTAKLYGLAEGKTVLIETISGSVKAITRLSASVMPGVVQVEVGPDGRGSGIESRTEILSICTLQENSTWRITQARVREA